MASVVRMLRWSSTTRIFGMPPLLGMRIVLDTGLSGSPARVERDMDPGSRRT